MKFIKIFNSPIKFFNSPPSPPNISVLTLLTGQVLTTVYTVRIVGAAVAVVHTGGIRHTAFLVVESKLLQKIISVVKALAIFDEKALRRHDGIHPLHPRKAFL